MRHGYIGFPLFLAVVTVLLVPVGCGGRKQAGQLVVHVRPSGESPRGFELDIRRGKRTVLHRPLAPLEVKLQPGPYVISTIWMFRGDPHGPPTYECGNRRLAIHANVRVDVVVVLKRLDHCPIHIGSTG